ncbi:MULTISPECIES: peroxidase family protein [Bradyrhizobium]|nr:peroxidase family protein [Bradyrhizobium elkanii]
MALRFRTIDGSRNNLADPNMNQADTDFARVRRISPMDLMK